jgi:polysaccharide deacetylase family protein (PEP-CTERM system associated)
MINAFTVDLEDWFQGLTSTNAQPEKWDSYESRLEVNAERLLALLAEYQVKATFFVLGHVARHHPDLVRRIDQAGHEIGVHGYWHVRVHRLTRESFAQELDRALEALTPLVKQPIVGHRAPYFSINGQSLWAIDVLQEKGFLYDSSFFPTRNMLYGYPGSPRLPHWLSRSNNLMEFPVSTARWAGVNWPIAGGFYVRSLPYVFIRRGVHQLNRRGDPAIIYVHPWELDTEQNYKKVTPRERITHYYGRRGLEAKLRRMFSDFKFTALREILDAMST